MPSERHIFPVAVSDNWRPGLKTRTKPDHKSSAPPVRSAPGSARKLVPRSKSLCPPSNEKNVPEDNKALERRIYLPPMDEIVSSNFDKGNVISSGDVDSELKELEVVSCYTSSGMSKTDSTSFGESSSKVSDSDGETNESGAEMQSFIIQSLDAATIDKEMNRAAQEFGLAIKQGAAEEESTIFYDSSDVELKASKDSGGFGTIAETFWKELNDQAAHGNATVSAKAGFKATTTCNIWRDLMLFMSMLLACTLSLVFAAYLKVKTEGLDSGPPPT